VTIWTLETFNEISSSGIPYTNTLVERSSSDIFGIRRDGDSCDTIFNAESQNILPSFNIPKSNCAVTTARSNCATVAGEIQRVDILLVASECISDGPGGNVPDSDQLVLGTSGKVSSIWTEANASDIKISNSIYWLILENANLLTGNYIKNLSWSIATSSNILSIVAESDTANNTFVLKSVNKINIKHTRNFWVENGEPIRLDFLLVSW
jgi:hypothetical protein